jgi:glyoxylase-like metal-dependent hydrolase (beta-lactamase superfamily II)
MEGMMQEQDLSRLGIYRLSLPIPFIEAGGPVNVYAVEEERGLLLFDTGLGTEESRSALAEGLAQIGRRFEDVNRIILSHGHIDHFGAAAWILEQAGKSIPVLINSTDADKVLDSGMDWPKLLIRSKKYFSKLGVPSQELEDVIIALSRNTGLGQRLTSVTPLLPGDIFRCKHVTLEVLSMPGHTPGLCCLYEREHRILFSADHLLERVSPNPLMQLSPEGEPTSFKPLISYFASLGRVREMAIDLVLPGHASPFANPCEIIDSLSSFYQRRHTKLLGILKQGPLTVYEVMRKLFSSNSGFALILMISETLGNLELLEEKGTIVRETGEFIRFRINQ